MEITRATHALKSTINTVESDIEEILKSGEFYCTEEIARELNAIRNGLEHMKLDSTLLASDEWQQSFNPRNTAAALSGATSVLDKAAARLFDYKCQLRAVPVGQKQENEVRELHQWAMTTLLGIQQDLEPYTYGAADRIGQFGDHVGVTDRYLGYRNNLTRGPRQPAALDTYWMDQGSKTGFMNPLSSRNSASGQYGSQLQRPHLLTSGWGPVEPDNIGSLGAQVRFSNDRAPMTIFRGYRTIDSLYPRSNTMTLPGVRAGGAPNPSAHVDNLRYMNSLNAQLADERSRQAAYRERGEACCENCDSAGESLSGPCCQDPGQGSCCDDPGECCQKVPGRHKLSVQEQAGINTTFPGSTEYMQRYAPPAHSTRVTDFLINPKPDMQVQGRPIARGRYDPAYTEYHTRYQWPDGNKISRCPWEQVQDCP